MPKYVCNGANMSCTFGSDSCSLNVLPTKNVQMEGNEAADIMDFKPMENLSGFGQCSSLVNPVVAVATVKNSGVLEPQTCIPAVVTPWMPGKPDALIANQPALMDFCINTCIYFGVITITDAGQNSISSDMAVPDMSAFIAEFEAGLEDAKEEAKKEAKKEIEEEMKKAAEK